MAKKPKHVVCLHCRLGQERELKQTFLGFFKFTCAQCEKESTYPLSNGYLAVYALAILGFVVGLAMGRVRFVILGVAGLFALAFDFKIRRAAKEARAHERTCGEVIAEVFE